MKYWNRFFIITLLWLVNFNGAAQNNPDHVTTEFIDLTPEGGNAKFREYDQGLLEILSSLK